jgi:hypothetical protein
LRVLEGAVELGLRMKRGRVFADLWDMNKDSGCDRCFERRVVRLRQMNLCQEVIAPVICDQCEAQ